MSARRGTGERVGVIPLSSPDGAVYAYACSTCHHVGGGSELLYTPDEPGPIQVLVESSLRDAESCCVCRACGGPAPRGVRTGLECEACAHWSAFVRIFTTAAMGYTDVRCEICGSRESRYCRETPKCSDCDEGHASNSSGRCRDCDIEWLLGRHHNTPHDAAEGAGE